MAARYEPPAAPIHQQLLEEDNTNDVCENDDEEDEDMSEYSVSNDEMEWEEANLEQRLLDSRVRDRLKVHLRGKNGFVWDTRTPACRSDRENSNVNTVPPDMPSLAGAARNCTDIQDFWNLLFNDEILNIIVEHTNDRIEEVCLSLVAEDEEESYHHATDIDEIRAYIGVLYYCGLWKSSNVDDNRLWDKANGITFYRCVFTRHRFSFLSTCIRFDNKSSIDKEDRFAPVRQIWDIFINNCQRYFIPGKKCTVDEQLLSFRGRCIFRMYIKSKPDKYGLKLITLNDAETSYLIHAIPYLGKQSIATRNESIPEYFFRVVTAPIHGTHRTVTCDNWFTTIPLMQRMYEEPFNLSITGTVRKNKREIPAEFKVAAKDAPSTKFAHAKNITLLSFTPKKNKIVILASSYLHTTEETNRKPNIVIHYNVTKGGTGCFDQLCHSYTVTRRTNRWPIRILYGMLDQAIVNARILRKLKLTELSSHEKCTAIDCLETLSLQLVTPFVRKRYETIPLRRDIKLGIAGIMKIDNFSEGRYNRVHLEPRQRCAVCSRSNDKKSNEACSSCKRPICVGHRLLFCKDCVGN